MSTTSTGSSSRPEAAPPGRSVPHTAADVAARLAELKVRPTKRRGQSFLIDPFVADAEAALAAEGRPARIVEVGGGLGILTEALLRRGVRSLTVIEREPALARFLRETFGSAIEVVEGDALTAELPRGATLVGNLPFSVGTPILERVWKARMPRFVGMLQREVADRIAAPPGSRTYGRLSIAAALYGSPQLFQTVPSSSFAPAPQVEGRVLTFTARRGRLPVPSVPAFERAVATLFSARRKQLGNLLPRLVPREAVDATAAAVGWPVGWAKLRPEALPPEAFFRLAVELERRGAGAGRPRVPSERHP